MKRHVQETGVRKYFGGDLIELQSEPFKVLDSLFEDYEPCIIQGCEIAQNSAGGYDIAAGMVALEAEDTTGVRHIMAIPFAGATGVTLPVYLTVTRETVARVYGDGKSKPVAYDYTAAVSAVKPAEGTSYIEITTAGGRRFVDVVQDAEHRFITDAERTKWNAKETPEGAQKKVDDAKEAILKQVAQDMEDGLDTKADLDAADHILPQQIAPQQGRQQGVRTEYGYYKSTEASLNPEGSQTHVVTFVTGDDVTTSQTVAAGKNFAFTIAGEVMVSPITGGGLAPIIAGKLYQAVYVIDDEAQTASLYLNGAFVAKSAAFQASTALFIGRYNDTNFRQFKGTVVDYRQFSFAMRAEDVAEVWNGGRPTAWRVPSDYRKELPSSWPASVYTASANTWRENNPSYITYTPNVPAANGFSGEFEKFTVSETTKILSTYNSFRQNYATDKACWQYVKFEYRCDKNFEFRNGTTVASFAANTGDAKVGYVIFSPNTYGGFFVGEGGTYLEIRTLEITTLGLCTSAFEQESLLPEGWRNMIDGGTDLKYTSYEDDTAAVFDYTVAEEPYTVDVVRRGSMTTGAVMGKGLFNSSAPSLVQKGVQHTTTLLFVTPSVKPSGKVLLYCEGEAGTTIYGARIKYDGNVELSFRDTVLQTKAVPVNTLCCVVFSYFGDEKIITAIDGEVLVNDNPEYNYDHYPKRMILGGAESVAAVNGLTAFRFIAARRFDFAMNEEQVRQIFNNGRPELWQVPDVWRNISPSKWPTATITESKDTWRVNHTTMTVENDVAAANGFSGKFQRFTKGTGTALSIYNGWRTAEHGSSAERMTWQFVTLEYRCDAAANLTSGLPVPTSLPANAGDAKTVTVLCAAGSAVNISALNNAGTYIEVRTTRIRTVGCILDLVPESLTPKLWRDASGQGNDVPYIPAGTNPAECAMSCEQVTVPLSIEEVADAIEEYLPDTYPANGGNADTVDGKHADDFMRVENITASSGSIDSFINYLRSAGFIKNRQAAVVCKYPATASGAITTPIGNIPLAGAVVTVNSVTSQDFSVTIQAQTGVVYRYTPVKGVVIAKGNTANALTVKLNGENPVNFDGSTAKEIDITPDAIGAVSSFGLPGTEPQDVRVLWKLYTAATVYIPGQEPAAAPTGAVGSTLHVKVGDPVYVMNFNPTLPLTGSGLTISCSDTGDLGGGKVVFDPDNNINLVGAAIFTSTVPGTTGLRITGFMFIPTPGAVYTLSKSLS